jgi:hypothetical protein
MYLSCFIIATKIDELARLALDTELLLGVEYLRGV